MTYHERPFTKRILLIATYLEAHPELPDPSAIYPQSVSWAITGRPADEAAVLATCDNWKLMSRSNRTAFLTGYHPALGCVLLDVDRYEAGPAERDWDSMGVAVVEEVGA